MIFFFFSKCEVLNQFSISVRESFSFPNIDQNICSRHESQVYETLILMFPWREELNCERKGFWDGRRLMKGGLSPSSTAHSHLNISLSLTLSCKGL